jgi:hypothetical protein
MDGEDLAGDEVDDGDVGVLFKPLTLDAIEQDPDRRLGGRAS